MKVLNFKKRDLHFYINMNLGSYTESEGLKIIRQDAAEFIKNRDGGIPCKWDDVFLTTGASDGIKVCLFVLINQTVKT